MITVNKGTCFLLLMGLLQGCIGSSQHTGVWNAAAEPGAGLDAALAQCQTEVTPRMINVRTEYILEENAQRRECEKAIRQSPEAKATYVDDGFGGLKALDDNAIAEMCEPSLGERRRREAEIMRQQNIAMVPCMQRMGYDLITSP